MVQHLSDYMLSNCSFDIELGISSNPPNLAWITRVNIETGTLKTFFEISLKVPFRTVEK